MDAQRNWFKAAFGVDLVESPRDISFCTHTIQSTRPLVVPDTTQDLRFVGNPFVCGDAHIRFYAGAPITVGPNQQIGTVCVYDVVPREAVDDEVRMLVHLAEAVSEIVRLRQSVARMGSLNELRHPL